MPAALRRTFAASQTALRALVFVSEERRVVAADRPAHANRRLRDFLPPGDGEGNREWNDEWTILGGPDVFMFGGRRARASVVCFLGLAQYYEPGWRNPYPRWHVFKSEGRVHIAVDTEFIRQQYLAMLVTLSLSIR